MKKIKLVKESLNENNIIFDNGEFQIIILEDHGYGNIELEIIKEGRTLETSAHHAGHNPENIAVYDHIIIIYSDEGAKVIDTNIMMELKEVWTTDVEELSN